MVKWLFRQFIKGSIESIFIELRKLIKELFGPKELVRPRHYTDIVDNESENKQVAKQAHDILKGRR